MAAEPRIRAASDGDLDGIIELLRLSLGEGGIPRDETYWTWKHRKNPFGPSPVLIAEADGAIVGLRVFMRWAWRAAGEVVPAVRAVDTATHPAWQGRGIFSKLTRALIESVREEGASLVFNTPNSKSRPGYLKMGWRQVGRTDVMIRPVRPFRIGQALAERTFGRGSDLANDPPAGAPSAGEVLFPGDALAEFLAAAGPPRSDTRLQVARTLPYLRWRFAEVPGFSYHTLAECDGSSGALICFRYKAQGSVRELRICDFVVGPDRRSRRIARRLLARLLDDANADYISAMSSPGNPEFGTLLRSGFLPCPRLGPIMTVLPLNPLPGSVDPLSRRNWRLSIGDLELF